VLTAVVGGVIGALLTMGLINGALGPALEENMGAFFPYFRTPMAAIGIALAATVLIGVASGLVPAIGASRRRVTDALRRID
jgi:ABC-type antimicrobial peptide transport system permease subunit